jgi:hypothetical protein
MDRGDGLIKLLESQGNLWGWGYHAGLVVRGVAAALLTMRICQCSSLRSGVAFRRSRPNAAYPSKVVEKNPPGDSKKSELPETFLRNWR